MSWKHLDPNGVEKVLRGQTATHMPAVLVRKTAAEATANGIAEVLLWDAEVYDTDNMHDTSSNTSRITIKTSGKYLVTANVAFDVNSSGPRGIYIQRNGTSVREIVGEVAPTPTYYTQIQISGVMDLVAGEYIEVSIVQASGGALNVLADGASSVSRFGATYIGPGILAQGQPLTTYGTTFPSPATDGAIHIYPADSTNRILWQFRYNAASASAYKWEFVGGPPIRSFTSATEATGGGGFRPSSGGQLSVPLIGDYLLSYYCRVSGAPNASIAVGWDMYVAYKIGAGSWTMISDTYEAMYFQQGANNGVTWAGTIGVQELPVTFGSASTVLAHYAAGLVNWDFTANNRAIILTPVRVQ